MSKYDVTMVSVSTPLPALEDGKRDVYLPLGCLYLISALENAGIDVEFRDYQLFSRDLTFPLDIDHFQSFLADPAPIVAVSCMVSMLPFVLLGTKRFKDSHPGHKVIIGGPGPSGVAEAIVSSLPWIDIVGRGEGEATLVEVVRALKNGGDLRSVQGISYRDDSCFRHNPQRPRITNLDELPLPAYGRIDPSKYNNFPVITGRGCPYRCSFCDVGPLWGNKTLWRSIDRVLDELELLGSEYGVDTVVMADDTFDLKRKRVEAFCEGAGSLGIKWSCLARVDLMDEHLIEQMARAGCNKLFLGIESGSDAVLERIDKRFTIKEATKSVEMSTRYMDRVISSFIWGFPFETFEDFKLTLFSVVSMWHLGSSAGLKLLSPMPLSRLGIEYRDQLEFSEDLCSVFASLGNVASGEKPGGTRIPEDFQEFIKRYPDIFAGFYYIKSDSIREKADYLGKFTSKHGIVT